jgi:hypothetical protein
MPALRIGQQVGLLDQAKFRRIRSVAPRVHNYAMKLFRYRRPSLNNILGITAAKRRVRRSLGISQVEAYTKPSRVKQKLKREVGLYSPEATVIRQTARGRFPTFLGLGRRREK